MCAHGQVNCGWHTGPLLLWRDTWLTSTKLNVRNYKYQRQNDDKSANSIVVNDKIDDSNNEDYDEDEDYDDDDDPDNSNNNNDKSKSKSDNNINNSNNIILTIIIIRMII